MSFDISALRKYDVSGPRYTSYPVAPVFHEAFASHAFSQAIAERNSKRHLSLYVHIPYCDTLCYFCGCNMKVCNDREVVQKYLALLEKEISLMAERLAPDSLVSQLHWGGGTPTHLTPEEISRLGTFIRDHFSFSDQIECSVEIDPRGIGRETIQALRGAGFNRASLGLQDFDLKVQKAVNRIHSFDLVSEVVSWIQEEGFSSLNLDLIYGLPCQSPQSFSKTVDLCLGFNPDRLAIFNFAYLPHMIKHQKVIDAETLPSAEEKLQMLEETGNRLLEANYFYIGMDHFAREGDSLLEAQRNKTLQRNFQGYSTCEGVDLLAFGASGISQLEDVYAQNIKNLPDYSKAVCAGRGPYVEKGWKLDAEDLLRRDIIFTLMCHFEITFDYFEKKYHFSFEQKFKEELLALRPFIEDECLEIRKKKILVTEKGRLIIRNIVMCFDAYLDKISSGKPRFSRTI
jgi:oxygen-independent coproporphyrinogen-3 oxidase